MQTAEQVAKDFYQRFGVEPTPQQIQDFFPDFLGETVRVYRNIEDLVAGYCETVGIDFVVDDLVLVRDLQDNNLEAIEAIAEVMGLDMVSDLLNR